MIVDCHTHIDLSVDASDIANYLAAAENVDACIALGCPKPDHDQVNEALGKFVAIHADKVLGFGVINPTEKTVTAEYLTRFTEEWRLQGFVLYCSACGFHPTHSDAMTFYQAISEMGLPVFFHNGDLDVSCEGHLAYAQPFLLDEVGNVTGGLRTSYVDAPAAVLSGLGQVGNAFCFLFGTTELFDAATMAARYIDKSGYKAAVSDAVARGIERGTLLQNDAQRIIDAADLQWDMLAP